MRRALAVAAALGLGIAGLALAPGESRSADEPSGRYTMSPADGGFVRLDTQTGAMSQCTKQSGQWACEPMADSDKALREENQRLSAEVKSLQEQVKGMEEVFGLGDTKAAPDGTKPRAELKLPSEQDVDQAFDYLERMVKKFQERMKKLEQENKSSTPL